MLIDFAYQSTLGLRVIKKKRRLLGISVGLATRGSIPLYREREFFIDNLLVQIHFIIVMIRWTGLALWEFEYPFPGSLTSTFLPLYTLDVHPDSKMVMTRSPRSWPGRPLNEKVNISPSNPPSLSVSRCLTFFLSLSLAVSLLTTLLHTHSLSHSLSVSLPPPARPAPAKPRAIRQTPLNQPPPPPRKNKNNPQLRKGPFFLLPL
jgi:hypothetical protein